jgi:hypothetical protein
VRWWLRTLFTAEVYREAFPLILPRCSRDSFDDLRSRYRNMCRFNSGVRSTLHVTPPVLTKLPSSSIATHYYNNFDTTGASSASYRF